MGWEIEEIKSLVVLGGLPTVGFILGSVVEKACSLPDMTAPGVGALIGCAISIGLVVRRIYLTVENGIF
jgi:hypothetical protein